MNFEEWDRRFDAWRTAEPDWYNYDYDEDEVEEEEEEDDEEDE